MQYLCFLGFAFLVFSGLHPLAMLLGFPGSLGHLNFVDNLHRNWLSGLL
jgi:hypothetical protein